MEERRSVEEDISLFVVQEKFLNVCDVMKKGQMRQKRRKKTQEEIEKAKKEVEVNKHALKDFNAEKSKHLKVLNNTIIYSWTESMFYNRTWFKSTKVSSFKAEILTFAAWSVKDSFWPTVPKRNNKMTANLRHKLVGTMGEYSYNELANLTFHYTNFK